MTCPSHKKSPPDNIVSHREDNTYQLKIELEFFAIKQEQIDKINQDQNDHRNKENFVIWQQIFQGKIKTGEDRQDIDWNKDMNKTSAFKEDTQG